MLNYIRRLGVALAAALAFLMVAAIPASATAGPGNRVTNYWRSNSGFVVYVQYIGSTAWHPITVSYQSLSNVNCLKPNMNAWSYPYNGLYSANVVRCFGSGTSNYDLILTGGHKN